MFDRWVVPLTIVIAALFIAIMIPVAEADRVHQKFIRDSHKAEVVAIIKTAPEPMTVSEIRTWMAPTSRGDKHGIKYINGLVSSLHDEHRLSKQRVRMDNSPARWYDGASNTKVIWSVK